MITASNLISLLPILIISITTIAVMLMIAIHRQHQITVWITACGLGVALISIIIPATAQLPQQVSPLLLIDQYSLFFTAIICSAGVALTFLSSAYFNEPIARHGFTLPANDKTDRGRYGAVDRLVAPGSVPGKSTSEHNVFYLDEYYALLTLSILGAVILVSSSHFASFFLGMEVLGIPLLAMIAYSVNNNHSIEAGVKYLVLTAFASAFLLFGMALIYAKTGTLNFAVLAFRLNTGTLTMNFYVISGVMLLITGVGIKLSLAPFHMWTPDVYQGAPTPVSAFLATVSKGAMFVVLMRYVLQTEVVRQTPVIIAFSAVAIASMLAGNLLALLQNNIKRLLAYSSIAHLGYLLVALLASKALAIEAASYFLIAYIITNLGAFGTVSLLETGNGHFQNGKISAYRGLFWQHPWLGSAFTLILLSLAGIPLTVGFMGKFYIMAAGVEHSLWPLVLTVIVGSAMGLFYYSRIVIYIFSQPEPVETVLFSAARPLAGGITVLVITIMLLWLGIYPASLINVVHRIALSGV